MFRILGVFLIGLLVSGCVDKVDPVKPQIGVFESRLSPKSTIVVPISIDATNLQNIVDQKIPSPVYVKHTQDSQSLSYKVTVTKSGAVQIKTSKNQLDIMIPLNAKANGTKIICGGWWHNGRCKGIKTSEHATANENFKVFVKLKLDSKPDYTISIKSDITPVTDGKVHLNMDLFGSAIKINYDITDKVMPSIERATQSLSNEIDAYFKESLKPEKVKEEIESYWTILQNPIEAGDLWINLKPEEVIFSGIYKDHTGNPSVAFGFSGRTELSLTKPSATNLPLPPLSEPENTSGAFSLNIPVSSTFDDLKVEFADDVIGKRFEEGDYWFETVDVDFSGINYSENDSILAKIEFISGKKDKKKAQGFLYFIATPSYDEVNRVIEITDFKLSSDTSNILVDKGLEWIAQLKFEKILSELKYELGPDIDKYKTQLNSELQKGIQFDDFTILGDIRMASISGVYVSATTLEAYTNFTGTIQTRFNAK